MALTALDLGLRAAAVHGGSPRCEPGHCHGGVRCRLCDFDRTVLSNVVIRMEFADHRARNELSRHLLAVGARDIRGGFCSAALACGRVGARRRTWPRDLQRLDKLAWSRGDVRSPAG